MLGPKEPNLYKDLSQGTVTKGIQIKIFSPKKILKKKFFFENLDLDPDGESGSRLCIWITIWIQIQIFKKNSKNFFFLIFTFPYVTITKI